MRWRLCKDLIFARPGRSWWRKCGLDIPFQLFLQSLFFRITMADNSLSSVVSGLVRAQMGTSLSSSVTDEDLDRHVAELILKEAKKKAEQYGQQGIRAYLTQSVHLFPLENMLILTPFVMHYITQTRGQCTKDE